MSDSDPGLMTIFSEALERIDPAERAAYLDVTCGDDAPLRRRVEALLAAHGGAGRFLEPDATGMFEPGSPVSLETIRDAASDASLPAESATEILAFEGTIPSLANATAPSRPAGFVSGQVIGGRYTLVEVLGEGGMGTVYRAEQSQPVKRIVALKLIKIGMDSRTVLARFDAERQALAMMDHPNIARVYDGGATDANQPFFVMEFVHGVAITDYCDQHRLSVDARLQLFVAVCQAVQHAHQKGIIHRDLKPSNVMVTEVDGRPTPKVIDFGVAKATESTLTDQTLGDTGAIVGTPTYMSPEQADPSTQDIDTRTDIYALGVILYELLAGSPPLDASQFQRGALLEMLRMVREVDPSKPSTKVSTADALPSIAANRGIDPEHLKRELRGDLDWIVMKALEKDRTRRYETANGLGADILRHLASEPVLAAPPSRAYRLRKFVRKHRAGVLAASLVVLALVAGVTGTTWGLIEARRSAKAERLAKLDAQEKEALAEQNEQKALKAAEGERLAKQKALAAAEEEKKAKETAEDVLSFVENKVFSAARPKGQVGGLGFDVTLAAAIAAALPSIEDGFKDRPLTEARLRRTIGWSFFYLGKSDLAEGQFEAARLLYSRHIGPDHPDTLLSMSNLAVSSFAVGRHAEALKLNEETLALRKAKLGPDHLDTLASMNNLANCYNALGRHAEALKLYEETLALRKSRPGPDHPDTLLSMNNLANCYNALGRHAEAIKLCEETLKLQRARLGLDHPDTLRSMNNLANCYNAVGRHAEALKLNEETLALLKCKLGPDHPDTLRSMNNLANCYNALGRHAEALKLNEETLALRKSKLGPDHPDTLESMHMLAYCCSAVGRHAEALKLHEETLALQRARLGPDHRDTLGSMNNVALSYDALGRHAEALKLHEETLALRKARLGPDHRDTLASMNNLANCYNALGRHAEALKLYEETLALQRARLGPDHRDTLASITNLANCYNALGRQAEALKLYEETLALLKAKLGPDHPETLTSMDNLANSFMKAGRTSEALSLWEKLSAAQPEDTLNILKVAELQAWFGREEDFAATRKRALATAKKSDDLDVYTAEQTVRACSILPSADKAETDASVVLARHAADRGKEDEFRDYILLSLCMAEYRAGHFAEADAAAIAAINSNIPGRNGITETSAFYRSMSMHRLGKPDEARKLATEAAAKMRPLPKDEKNPLADGGTPDDLILWLAYKEAKALIGFDPPPHRRRPTRNNRGTGRVSRQVVIATGELTSRGRAIQVTPSLRHSIDAYSESYTLRAAMPENPRAITPKH